nr:NADH dehydrogenase subunit 2 [Archotermopsis wroughtoni]
MPNNSTKILLLTTLMSGTLISISSNSWFGAWMGLEINLLSFIPMMIEHKNSYTIEASLKYFIVQAGASSMLLFMVMTKALNESVMISSNTQYMQMMINTPLLLKSGAAPMHWWFPSVMEGLNWNNCLLLMTLQKLAPLSLMSYQMKNDMFLEIIILTSVTVGAIGGLNQTSLRKIMTYSSINHMGWMLAATITGDNMWVTYFIVYSMLTSTVVLIVNNAKVSFINQTSLMEKKNKLTKMMMFMSLLSLGGLPPFLGFLPKWIIIQAMITNTMTTTVTIMVMMSVITLYYYMRMAYSSMIILHHEPKWLTTQPTNKTSSTVIMLTLITLTGLLMCAATLSLK